MTDSFLPALRAIQRATTVRLHRWAMRQTGRWCHFDRSHPSKIPVDVFTPMIPKDIPVFRETSRLLRENLLHPIGTHYVVGPPHDEILQVCEELGCQFVDEAEALPIGLERVREEYINRPHDRSGWLFQQLLKLNAHAITQNDNVLVIDSDTAFVRPVRLEINNRWIFDVTHGYESMYDDSLKRLLGVPSALPYSFVVHYMVFNRHLLKAFQQHIETRFGLPWAEGILQNLDLDNFLCFSEWNVYANFVLPLKPDMFQIGYWFNVEGSLNLQHPVRPQIEALANGAKTVSLHFYKRARSTASSSPAAASSSTSQSTRS